MDSKSLRVAVLILPPIQLLDLSPVDLFHMMSKQYITECKLPQPLIDAGLEEVDIHYVAEHGPLVAKEDDTRVAEMTANAAVRVTDNFASPSVQPGTIDILMIPGPDPSSTPSEAAKQFIRAHAARPTTTVMSVCTGVFPLGYSGVLDGKQVTGPRALVGMTLKKQFPKAHWVEKRWEVDESGKLWTAGGITNGQDMVAAYLRAHFSRELSGFVCAMADVGDRGQEYVRSKAGEGAFWGWLLLRSWIKSMWRGKSKPSKDS